MADAQSRDILQSLQSPRPTPCNPLTLMLFRKKHIHLLSSSLAKFFAKGYYSSKIQTAYFAEAGVLRKTDLSQIESILRMGAQVSKIMGRIFGSKEMRLLMLGLDAAGKTSTFSALITYPNDDADILV